MLRRVPFKKIENFRDLGGYQASYGETAFGIVYRSGSLSDATDKDVATLKSLGIKTVIDLRSDDDKLTKPDKTANDPAFKELLLPVNGNGRIPKNKRDQIASYLEMLTDHEKAKAVFDVLLNSPKPLVIHCSAGKDRTGTFIMILLLANGVPFHDVNADYLLSFAYLSRLTRISKKDHPEFPKVIFTPDVYFLKKVMEAFDKIYGTIHHYFEVLGYTPDQIAELEHLLEAKKE
ncbi:MAG: tyrosine-protein phosphatase [Bacilli bacterium]|jgi:protein-tyrosine phosphatase|nr:tyrosine-protein phosphatase [Bacilli bacterium]